MASLVLTRSISEELPRFCGNPAFDASPHVSASCCGAKLLVAAEVVASPAGAAAPAPLEDAPLLRAEGVAEFCAQSPQLQALVGAAPDVEVLGGGLMNRVYRVSGQERALLVKVAPPFCYARPENIVTQARLKTEAAAMQLAREIAPSSVPEVYLYDEQHALMACEFKEGCRDLTTVMQAGDTCPGVGRQLGAFCARLAHQSSRSVMGARFQEFQERIADSFDGCGSWMERVVLYNTFDPTWAKNDWPAELDDEVAAYVHNDGTLLAEVAALRALYRAPDDPCFLHTDTWTGNVLVDAGGCMTTIDYEFGQLGPSSYDIGHVLCVGIMSALAMQAHDALEAAGTGVCRAQTAGLSADALAAARRQQLAWLVRLPTEAWAAYETESAEQADGRPLPSSRLADALGYAGITILRWSLGEFNLFTMLGLPEDCGAARLAAVRRAMYLGTCIIRRRHQLCSMQAVQQLLECALTWDAQGPVPATLVA